MNTDFLLVVLNLIAGIGIGYYYCNQMWLARCMNEQE